MIQAYEKEHLQFVNETAAECTVLLKSNGTFPLQEAGNIAAFGSGVRYTIKGGTGSGEVNVRASVNIEQGLTAAGFTITSTPWLDAYDAVKEQAHKQFVKQVQQEAFVKGENIMLYCMGKIMPEPEHNLPLQGEGDTAIYVVTRISGEGADRMPQKGDIQLADSEIRDILALDARYKRFMLVLNVGGVVDLSPVAQVSNILVLSQLGAGTGTVLADILLGKQNPSGKLATTWTAWEDYSQIGDFGRVDDTYYKEGIYVGYRYFDSVGKKPLFSFGYGLSYTTFSMTATDMCTEKDLVTIGVDVENTGAMAGKEVVQVYISAPNGKLDKPYQGLAAFCKSRSLAPGEKEHVELTFSMRDVASYDEESASYVLDQGNYIIRVGNSSANTKVAGVVILSDFTVVLKAKNVLGHPSFEDYKPENRILRSIPAGVKVIPMAVEDIESSAVQYDVDYPVNDRIKALSDEELAYVNIGAIDSNADERAVIGNAATQVAGAAGESTSLLRDKGLKALIMADGPAGLRLAKEYYVDENGAHDANATAIPASMLEFLEGLPGIDLAAMAAGGQIPENIELKEQYATALPIGTAIAQSFNCDLAKSYGDIVGAEMERFGVHLWLAPALNIHRSIQCGRNFEYYSEDPLVSGMMAAAITEGVQAHPGCGTTIKHYAANNQETNRFANNSHVSERAMREIYLKGFGICVKRSCPKAVMTSYNLLNGTHTSEHRGLVEEILRNEFGFDGIVMTDWIIQLVVPTDAKYPMASSYATAAAGGDLFMPGSQRDYQVLLNALKEERIDRKQIEINATRVYQMAEELCK